MRRAMGYVIGAVFGTFGVLLSSWFFDQWSWTVLITVLIVGATFRYWLEETGRIQPLGAPPVEPPASERVGELTCPPGHAEVAVVATLDHKCRRWRACPPPLVLGRVVVPRHEAEELGVGMEGGDIVVLGSYGEVLRVTDWQGQVKAKAPSGPGSITLVVRAR